MFVAPAALVFVVQLHSMPAVLPPPPPVPPAVTQQPCIKTQRWFEGIVHDVARAVATVARDAIRR